MFTCNHCDAQHLKWSGRCTQCQKWGTLSEESSGRSAKASAPNVAAAELVDFSAAAKDERRFSCGISEWDRVLEGGVVAGQVLLLSGEPGIGKSTLIAHIASGFAPHGVATSLDVSMSDARLGNALTIPPGGVPAFAGTGKGAQREDFEKMRVYCPGSGGSTEVRKVAESFIGKVNYRLGGKLGLTAPYGWELPPRKVPARRSPQGDFYGYFCPDDSLCLDCSGFVQVVAECAGLASRGESGGTGQIFQNAPRIASCDDDTVSLEDGSERDLEPGDYVGFGPQHTPDGFGHVWMYIGNGQLANSSGSGRSGNRGANIRALDWACANFPLYLRAVGT